MRTPAILVFFVSMAVISLVVSCVTPAEVGGQCSGVCVPTGNNPQPEGSVCTAARVCACPDGMSPCCAGGPPGICQMESCAPEHACPNEGGSTSSGGGSGGQPPIAECAADADCAELASDECKGGMCVDGKCEVMINLGPTLSQRYGDCKRRECDLLGAIIEVGDDSDSLRSPTQVSRGHACPGDFQTAIALGPRRPHPRAPPFHHRSSAARRRRGAVPGRVHFGRPLGGLQPSPDPPCPALVTRPSPPSSIVSHPLCCPLPTIRARRSRRRPHPLRPAATLSRPRSTPRLDPGRRVHGPDPILIRPRPRCPDPDQGPRARPPSVPSPNRQQNSALTPCARFARS
jgi:hypothetical protein